ncbi:MAG: ribonuclease Z [Candidatus Methanomethylophilaceae archaeon]|nr:ribonuclease Z [Candidatus Methanomethylophilaceae archaeon]MDY0224112.1 ribonuclease Z [Candidatus Methanomethylophilaceae archaeon]
MLDLLFLGTGASVPSRDRALPCVAVRVGRDIILFDCGEGSQRQMMISPWSFMKVTGIFITHMHGDHILGLPGLLQTMGLSGRKDPLIVCGPKGFKAGLIGVLSVCEGKISYDLDIRELEPEDTIHFNKFTISSFKTEHNTSSLGYILRETGLRGKFDEVKAKGFGIVPGPDFARIQKGETVNGVTPEMIMGPERPGCSIVYSGDTIPCEPLFNAAKDALVLIHEATYSHDDIDLAKEHWHSTATQAAITARDAGCVSLILIHVSNRYDDRKLIENEAKKIFENTFLVDDMAMFTVTKDCVKQV